MTGDVASVRAADRPRIIVVGAGFGGMAAVKALKGADADITLVDRTNHHLFQPLLYQVATAALAPADIATATRALLDARHDLPFRAVLRHPDPCSIVICT